LQAVAALKVPRAYTTASKGAVGRPSRPSRGCRPGGRPDPVLAGAESYRALLELSTEAIARFELQPPMRVDLAPDEQVEHILRHARIVECNDAYARLYDRSARGMRGHAVAAVIPEAERRDVIARFVASGYRLAHGDLTHVRGDGSTRWMTANGLGLVTEGRLRGYWVTLHDVTERKRMESERERRDRILEAVAFGAARMLEPGPMHAHAEAVLARLGGGADAARAWVVQAVEDPDGSPRMVFRFVWAARGQEVALDDPRIRGGISVRRGGLERFDNELRAGRPLVVDVGALPEAERAYPARMGSKAFAAVPIFANGAYWGFLGFGETRHERTWSTSEVEALKAAAAVFGAAIERERADEALLESKERFKRLSAAAFEGIAITEAGTFVDGNDQMAKILGCEVADLVGQPVEQFVAEEDRALVRSHLRSGSEEPYQHHALRADGSVVPVEIRARSMPYDGRTVRVSAIRDVSERVDAEKRQRRLESDLRHAAEQWRQTFDALDLGIVLADPEGRIVRLNRCALELVAGSRFKDAVGRRLEDIADEEPWRTLLDINWRVVSGGTSVVGETREPSTARSYYLLGSPWFRNGGPPWCVLTFRDVTEYTNMQAQLRRARTLEAMGSLVAGVAHEVRNPLFSISATVDAFENEFGQRPEFAEYSMLLRSQVVRLTQLMRDLLDYGKPSHLRRAPTRLGDVIRRAIRSCAGLARERQVRVEEGVPAEMPTLDVEAARVEQAVENLLANAIQHSPAGSVVRVGVSLEGDLGPPRARCTIEDEGPGVAAEDRERLFEPFFSRRKGGTGLGLPIVQRVAEAHGGTVSVENRPEGGARFSLLLPLAEATDTRRSARA
jgi:PAS domain S-box-containing protein